ncbi:MAG: hypothetical protein MJ252_08600, partial [archaeon]|nr:hypothetical protein [archaeon]
MIEIKKDLSECPYSNIKNIKYLPLLNNSSNLETVLILNKSKLFLGLDGSPCILIFSLEDMKLKYALRGHNSRVLFIYEMNDGNILSSSYDCTLKVFNINTKECLKVFSFPFAVSLIHQLSNGNILIVNNNSEFSAFQNIYENNQMVNIPTLKGEYNNAVCLISKIIEVSENIFITINIIDDKLIFWNSKYFEIETVLKGIIIFETDLLRFNKKTNQLISSTNFDNILIIDTEFRRITHRINLKTDIKHCLSGLIILEDGSILLGDNKGNIFKLNKNYEKNKNN